jgi:hypothetical protein
MGARFRSLHRISLPSGGATRELCHQEEAVYYVLAGAGSALERPGCSRQPLAEGAMAFIEPRTRYVLVAGDAGLELIGGPCPPDRALY